MQIIAATFDSMVTVYQAQYKALSYLTFQQLYDISRY